MQALVRVALCLVLLCAANGVTSELHLLNPDLLVFGDSVFAPTNLYRVNETTLRTDGNLIVGGQLIIANGGAPAVPTTNTSTNVKTSSGIKFTSIWDQALPVNTYCSTGSPVTVLNASNALKYNGGTLQFQFHASSYGKTQGNFTLVYTCYWLLCVVYCFCLNNSVGRHKWHSGLLPCFIRP